MNKAISVSLAKIDYDLGKPYIKIIADCPVGQQFVLFTITVNMLDGDTYRQYQYDASSAIKNEQGQIAIRLPINQLEGLNGPGIYEIHLQAEDITSFEKGEMATMILSDVTCAYQWMMDDLLASDKCDSLPDALIQKYLLLYAHEQAMSNLRLEEAKEYFKLIHKGFSKCGSNKRHSQCNCSENYDKCR